MLTGREARSLPPAVVRGLFWHVYAAQLWSPDLVADAHAYLPPGTPLNARIAKSDAATALAAIETVLFPEDD